MHNYKTSNLSVWWNKFEVLNLFSVGIKEAKSG